MKFYFWIQRCDLPNDEIWDKQRFEFLISNGLYFNRDDFNSLKRRCFKAIRRIENV